MPSQKLVRCEIRRRGSKEAGSPRYVPLEIYGLWEYLMTEKHGFEVVVRDRFAKDGPDMWTMQRPPRA